MSTDDGSDLLFSGHAYVDSDKTSTQAHNFYILLLLLLLAAPIFPSKNTYEYYAMYCTG